MTSSVRIAGAPKLLQAVRLSDAPGLSCLQNQILREQKVLSQGRGQALQGPRAALASPIDLQSESQSSTGVRSRRAPVRKPPPDEDGGVSIKVRVADRSGARSAGKQVLERLDNGLADTINGGQSPADGNADVINGGHSLGDGNGKKASVGRRGRGVTSKPQVVRAEAGSEARDSSCTSTSLASLSAGDRTAQGISSSGEEGAVVVSRKERVRPLSSTERRAARKAAQGTGNPAAAGFGSLGATVANSRLPTLAESKTPTNSSSEETTNGARITSQAAGIALQSNPPPHTERAFRSRGPKATLLEAADISKRADVSTAAPPDGSRSADVSRRLQQLEASTSGAPHHNNVPTVGTLRADRKPPQRSARERPPRWENAPTSNRARGRKSLEGSSKIWRVAGKKPIVFQVADALLGLGRGFQVTEFEGAVEKAVGKDLLEQMDVETWKEVLRIVAKENHCAQLEAVLEHMMSPVGCSPDGETFERVFFTLHRNRLYERALHVFQLMRESGFTGATNMHNAAMSAVTKLGGNVVLVEEIFEEMPVKGIPRDKFTYSTVMDAVWQAGIRIVRGRKDKIREATPRERRQAADKVEALYLRMVAEGLVPDTVAKNVVLNALVCSEAYARAEAMFEDMCADERVPPNDRTYTIMMHMYSEQKKHEKAQDVFNRMLAAGIPPTEITYNVLIRGCVGSRNAREAIRLYREMGTRGLARTSTTMNSLVEVFSNTGYFSQAEQVIYGMEIKGFPPSPEPYNMLITGLVRSRDCLIDEAMRVFQAMQLARVKPWALTFGALMEGFGKTGRLQEMEHVYRLMRYAKLQPTTTIFTAMIHAYIRADDLETSWELFAKMREVGLVPNVQTYTVLITGLAARGELDVIDDVFAEAKEELLELDSIIYEAAILAHVEHKSLSTAERLCQEMAREGMQINARTYDKLAALHTEAGRFDKAEEVWAEKRIAYPDWDDRRRAARLASGWLWERDEMGEPKRRRPLVIDDVWAALEGDEDMFGEGSASDNEEERPSDGLDAV